MHRATFRFASWTGRHAALAGLIALFLTFAVAYSAVTPASPQDPHNPDENAHVQYVRVVASGHLPVLRADRLALDGYEAHQPPLYYALCAPVYRLALAASPGLARSALRAVSILLGALLVVAVSGAARTLFPQEPLLALGAAGFVALLPMNVAVSASVTNDALSDLVAALAFWQLARVVTSPPCCLRRRSAWLGLALGLGVWTKSLCLPLFPAAALAFALMARARPATRSDALRAGGLCLGLGTLVASGWLARNQRVYGDPWAQRAFVRVLAAAGVNTPAASMSRFFGGPGHYAGAVAQWTQASFWGGFDSMRLFWGQPPSQPIPDFLRAPGPLYGLLMLLAAASVLGLLRSGKTNALTAPQRIGLRCGAVMIGGAVLLLAQFNHLYFQAQGRFLFPALSPLALFFVLGWRGLIPDRRRFGLLLSLLGVGLVALNLYTLFGLLIPRFHAAGSKSAGSQVSPTHGDSGSGQDHSDPE